MTVAELRAGDEVVVPAFGGAEAACAVRAAGARPIFADIDPLTFCLDPRAAEFAVTERTVALAPVHLFGHPADTASLGDVACQLGLHLIEFGASSDVIAVDAVRRRQHAGYLDRRLNGVVIPHVAAGVRHAYTEYVVKVPGNGRPDRDAFARALRRRGVDCHVPVKIPAHRLPELRTAGADGWSPVGAQRIGRLPEAEKAADETLALPLRAAMSKRELHRMVSACNALGGVLMEPAG